MRSLQRDPLYLELVHFYMIIYVHLYLSIYTMDMEHKNAVKRLSPLKGKKGCKRHLSRTKPRAVPSILDSLKDK